jgi:hypothetical protein
MPNFLTEDEAKTKWCPLARASSENDGQGTTINRGANPSGKPDIDCMCIASACMAWRKMKDNVGRPEGYCGAFGRQP